MRLIPICPVCGNLNLNGRELCSACREVLDGERFDNYMVRCPVCDMVLVSYDYVCPRCGYHKDDEEKGEGNETFIVHSLSPYFASISRRVLEQFKFGKDKSLARPIARFYLEALNKKGTRSCIVVHVPCSRKSLKTRGWDQMKEVAKAMERLGRDYGIECEHVSLIDNIGRNTAQQKNLTRAQRLEASKGKYALSSRISKTKLEKLKDSKILIVDDIYTTGATIDSCSYVLKTAGFTDVEAMTWLMEL